MNTFLVIFLIYSIIFNIESKVDPKLTEETFFNSSAIVNPDIFYYLINPGNVVCNKSDLFLLVYVHTSPQNYKRRLVIRETWGSRLTFPNIRVVFMMGYAKATANETNKKKINEIIQYESDLYGDIVQENFIDNYRNLTYKGIMAMKWISTHCSNAKFILKVDDDIIVNMFVFLKHFKHLHKSKQMPENSILCNVWTQMSVVREKNSKWYVNESEYLSDEYGEYCSGSAYMFTSDLPKKMYNASYYVKFFWVDDYYITGLLARVVKARYVPLNSVYVFDNDIILQKFKSRYSDYNLFGHSPGNLNKHYKVWSYLFKKELYKHVLTANNSDFKFPNTFKW